MPQTERHVKRWYILAVNHWYIVGCKLTHLNAYLMHALYLEYNVSTASLLNRLCITPITMQDGFIPVPDGPGLGVEVNETVVEQFRVL